MTDHDESALGLCNALATAPRIGIDLGGVLNQHNNDVAKRLGLSHFVDDKDECLRAVFEDPAGNSGEMVRRNGGQLFDFARSGLCDSPPEPTSWPAAARPNCVVPVAHWRAMPDALNQSGVRDDRQRPRATEGWPKLQCLRIQGEGKRKGLKPRGAGIIAFRQMSSSGRASPCMHVLIVEKASGRGGPGFPKGGIADGETVWQGAMREWSEETGISVGRLWIHPGVHVDDPHIGTRLLLADCEPPKDDTIEPDRDAVSWAPPNEDPDDPDPIGKAYWAPLVDVLRGHCSRRTALTKCRLAILQETVDLLGYQRRV